MGRLMVWAVATAMIGSAVPGRALARDSDAPKSSSGADETFHAARALLKDKRYADACPKFEESQRQDPASGTLLALAYCQELSGLLATSWQNYLAAAQLAEREGQTDRQTAAAERARALLPRMSRVTVLVPPELLSMPGFHLLRDGIEFERASIGLPIATDGGSHAFVASAPGRVSWASTVTLFSEHDQKTLVIPLLDAVAAPASTASTASTAAPARLLAPVSSRPTAADSQVAWQRLSLGLVAASAVGVGVGAAFGLSAKSKNDASNAGHCDGGCDDRGIELRHDALTAARVSTWAFVASGALAVSSLTLYLSARPRQAVSSRGARVQAGVSLGAPGVALLGSF